MNRNPCNALTDLTAGKPCPVPDVGRVPSRGVSILLAAPFPLSVPVQSFPALGLGLRPLRFASPQGLGYPSQGLARLRKPRQGPKKNSSASLSCKASPRSADFPVCFPKARRPCSIPQQSNFVGTFIGNFQSLPISVSPRLPLSLSHLFKVPESFCLSVPSLTSSPGQAISPNCQALHLPDPQRPSRVVKVRQASEKSTASSLDVKVSFLWPAFHLRLSASICGQGIRFGPSKNRFRQTLAPQSLLNLVQVSKSFSFYSPENLPVKPSPRSAGLRPAGWSGVPPRLQQTVKLEVIICSISSEHQVSNLLRPIKAKSSSET
jgi:hypothetical protein